MFAVFNIFLSRLTDRERIAVGMGVANRNHPDLERLVGFLVNVVVIQTEIRKEAAFEDVLLSVIRDTTEAFEHQAFPFTRVARISGARNTSVKRSVVNVMYTYQNFQGLAIQVTRSEAGGGAKEARALSFDRSIDNDFRISKHDLTHRVQELGPRLHLAFEFDSALFRRQTVERCMEMYLRFLAIAAGERTAGVSA